MIRPEAAQAFYRLTVALADVDGRVPCSNRDSWFDDDRDVRSFAARLCTTCPGLQACGNYAEAADERHGVWAGTDRTRHPGSKRGAA